MTTKTEEAREEVGCLDPLADHPIPAVTCYLGRSWQQPDRASILVDDAHALMTMRDFARLHCYDASLPSGVYEGKMWRSGTGGTFGRLWWYGPSRSPGQCSLNFREILIID